MKIIEMRPELQTIDCVQNLMRYMRLFKYVRQYDIVQKKDLLILKVKLEWYCIFPFSFFYKWHIENKINSRKKKEFYKILVT